MSVSHEPGLCHEAKVLGTGAKLELLVGERPLRHQRQHLAPEDDAVALRLRAVRMDEFQSPVNCELSHQLQQLIQGSGICCYQEQVISIADSGLMSSVQPCSQAAYAFLKNTNLELFGVEIGHFEHPR